MPVPRLGRVGALERFAGDVGALERSRGQRSGQRVPGRSSTEIPQRAWRLT